MTISWMLVLSTMRCCGMHHRLQVHNWLGCQQCPASMSAAVVCMSAERTLL